VKRESGQPKNAAKNITAKTTKPVAGISQREKRVRSAREFKKNYKTNRRVSLANSGTAGKVPPNNPVGADGPSCFFTRDSSITESSVPQHNGGVGPSKRKAKKPLQNFSLF
jgi:hypothetical protein